MKRFLTALLGGLSLLLIFSCSNAEPSVLSVTGTVVFDFADQESPPATRLAFFVQTDAASQRAESLVLSHGESGRSWLVSAPRMISGSEKNWVGYTNLQPAPGESIVSGNYTCHYTDGGGNELECHIVVDYPESLLSASAAKVRDCIDAALTEYIALYSETNELMFFNKRRTAWRSNSDIAKDYRNAYSLRRCLVTGNNGIVCLLPAEPLKTAAESDEE